LTDAGLTDAGLTDAVFAERSNAPGWIKRFSSNCRHRMPTSYADMVSGEHGKWMAGVSDRLKNKNKNIICPANSFKNI
jgi:hypothetical protein